MAEPTTEQKSDILPKVMAGVEVLADTANRIADPAVKGLKQSGERLGEALAPAAEELGNAAADVRKKAGETLDAGKVKAEEVLQAGKDATGKYGEQAQKISEEIGKTAAPAVKVATDVAAQANEQSGGFIEKNKGLLFGGAIALFALFGMEGGFLPMALAAIFLIGGGLSDDKGLFSNMFGGSKAPASGGDSPAQAATKTPEPEKKLEQVINPAPAVTTQEATPVTPPAETTAPAAPAQTGQNINADKVIVKRGANRTVLSVDVGEQQAISQNTAKTEPVYTDNKVRLNDGKTTFSIDEKGDLSPSDKPGSMRVRVNSNGEVVGVAIADSNGKTNVLVASELKVTLPVTDGHIDLKDEAVRAPLKALFEERERKDALDIMRNNTSNMQNIDTASITPQHGLPKLTNLNNGRVV